MVLFDEMLPAKQSDRTNNKCPGRMIKGMSGWANSSSGYLRFELLHSSLPWQATNRVVRRTALHNGGGQLPRLLECVGGELVKTEYRLPSRLAIFLNFHMKTKTSPGQAKKAAKLHLQVVQLDVWASDLKCSRQRKAKEEMERERERK